MMARILILMLLGISCAVVAQSPQRIEAMRMVQQGDNRLQVGQFQDAIFSYTNAITTDNSFTDAYMKRSSLYQRLGQTTQAKQDYDAALRINPYSANLLDEEAKLSFMIERYTEGLENLEHAIAMEPDNYQLRDHRVDGYILTGEYQQAKNDLELLRETGFNEELIVLKQGLIQFLENDLIDARNSFEQVLEINSGNALALDVLGLILIKHQNYDEAIQRFDEAIAVNPSFALAIYNKGVAYKLKGMDAQALTYFDQAIDAHLNIAPVYFARGLLRRDVGDYKGAISDYSQLTARDSIYFDAIYNRAFTYEMIGEFDNALSDANEAIELDPEDAHAWKLRGNIHMLFGDYGEAIIDFTQALKLDDQMIEALFSRGLSKVLNYRLKDGCQDMRLARDMGYEGGDDALGNFCGP
jgi:tetratricopeptide (TPR) repeat protein